MLQLLPKRCLYSLSWQAVERGEQSDSAVSLNTEDTCLSLKLSCCDMSSLDSGVRNCCTMFRGFRSASWCKICNTNHQVRLQDLKAMAMKTAAFCDVMSCTLADIYWCFRPPHPKKNPGTFVCARPSRPEGKIEVFLHSFLTSAQDRSDRPQTSRKEPWYPLDKRLGGFQRQSAHFGDENNFLSLPGFVPWIIQPAAKSLYWIYYVGPHVSE